jgi:hypothetical protein
MKNRVSETSVTIPNEEGGRTPHHWNVNFKIFATTTAKIGAHESVHLPLQLNKNARGGSMVICFIRSV